ncbi:hypothetical protein BGZ72_000477 [Mortierella alpina]|nr:hypothetical protein BGZ72_000477 [Mortierella alpina]
MCFPFWKKYEDIDQEAGRWERADTTRFLQQRKTLVDNRDNKEAGSSGTKTTESTSAKGEADNEEGSNANFFYRGEAISESLQVKSPVPQTLVFIVPRKDTNPDELLTLILKAYTVINSFHHRTLPTTVQFFITVDDPLHYEYIRRHPGLTINGRTYAPIVPIPNSLQFWRVSFRFAPHSLTVEQFISIFDHYGNVAEIGRYYIAIENSTRKIYTWDGYVMLQGKVDKDGNPVQCTPVPETLDIGGGVSISTKTAANTPNTSNNTNTDTQPNNKNHPGSVNNLKPPPSAKSKGKKRQQAAQQDNTMETVVSTGTPTEHHQQKFMRVTPRTRTVPLARKPKQVPPHLPGSLAHQLLMQGSLPWPQVMCLYGQ